MEISGSHIVVTGGASGIGRAMVERFKKEGARALVVADMNGDGARAVAAEVGGTGVQVDVSDESQIQALVESAQAENGPIDLFCSNAGIAVRGGVEAPDEAWMRLWSVNVMAHIYAARAVLPTMLARRSGYLLQTASAAGLLTQLGSAPYSVTKHAAVSLAEWLSVEYGDRGIGVSVLCPQAVRTGMADPAVGALSASPALVDGMLEADEVADCVVAALREERFLILPHPTVLEYSRRRTGDKERWLAGMRRMRRQMIQAFTRGE
jgi:NAD(P)-dependent dehydrogenase (short-subunit alcohol dehydrogenase family)